MKVGILGLGLIGGSLARAYALEGHTVYAAETNESMLPSTESWMKKPSPNVI